MVEPKSTRRPRVRRFTEVWLREQLGRQRPAREEWGDADKPGLRARFGTSGAITWVHYRSAAGKQEVLVLGRYPDLGLADARSKLDEERSRARQGMVGLSVPATNTDWTVEHLVTKFVASLAAHRKHPRKAELELTRYVLKRGHGFKSLKAAQVARPAWHAIIEEIAAAGHATQAARIHRLLGQLFDFAVQLNVMVVSPFQGLKARALGAVEPPPRQRVLNPEELRQLLAALHAPCPRDAKTGRLALLLLLLTGKRTGELIRARWERVDLEGRLWTIPEADRKSTMHAAIGDEVVPLSPAAVVAFQGLREVAEEAARRKPAPLSGAASPGASGWVFASPHSSASGRISDTTLSRTARELLNAEKVAFPHWTPHDLRRTARTYWSEKLGVPWDLAERLLGHALPKIARTYDAGTYLEQRRAALEKWGAYLEQLQGPGAKVVVLGAGGGR